MMLSRGSRLARILTYPFSPKVPKLAAKFSMNTAEFPIAFGTTRSVGSLSCRGSRNQHRRKS
jgi:hypothetical protein